MQWLSGILNAPEIAIALVIIVPVILGIVEMLKRLGMNSKWAPLASVGIGVLLMLAGTTAEAYPGFAPWIIAIIVGLVLGLAASGLYSGQKKLRGE